MSSNAFYTSDRKTINGRVNRLNEEKRSESISNKSEHNASAKNSRDHGSYHSFYIIPRVHGNVKNAPNLVG